MLAVVSVYGVLAQFVAQRRAEIAVRRAVGARTIHIAQLIAWKGAVPAFAGLVSGFALSAVAGRYLRSVLYGVAPTDPATFLTVDVVVTVAMVVAMIVPARQASRIDPMTVLRSE